MTKERAMRLAAKWANGGVCTLSEGEAQEYHELCLAALKLFDGSTPCVLCAYGGKHLDAPPCATCPAFPKGR